jgi:hypothetical protein
VTVAEIMAATSDPTAAPPRHRPQLAIDLPGPLQTRRTTRLPAPPARIRPPDLLADEQGVQLYGSRRYDRGQIAIARLRADEAASVRLYCDFDASSVTVHNLGAVRLVVAIGEEDPLTENAVGFVPVTGWATITLGGARVLRVGTIDGSLVTSQVVVVASDRVLAPGAGQL